MISPIIREPPLLRRLRARSSRLNPSSRIAALTLSAVAVAMAGSALTTRETVLRLTPARAATSFIVGRRRVGSVARPAAGIWGSENTGVRDAGALAMFKYEG